MRTRPLSILLGLWMLLWVGGAGIMQAFAEQHGITLRGVLVSVSKKIALASLCLMLLIVGGMTLTYRKTQHHWPTFVLSQQAAQAQTWSLVHDSNNYLPTAAASGTVGNGWTDSNGSAWSINSSHQIVSGIGTNYNHEFLLRPLGEAGQDERIIGTVNSYAPGSADIHYVILREQTSEAAYIALAYQGTLYLYSLVGGATTTLTSNTYTATAGHTLTLDFTAVGISPTVLTATLTDTTTTTVLRTITINDSTAGLQTSGRHGLSHYSVNAFDRVQTYNAVTPATAYTLTGTLAGSNGSANILTLQSNGNLAGAATVTVSVTAGAATLNGTSVTSVNVTLGAGSNTSATFMVQSASAGSSTLHFVNDSSLTNPADATYSSSAAPTTISVGDTHIFYSPYNWYSNGTGNLTANGVRGPPTSTGSSTYILSNMCGAYLKTQVVSTTSAGSISVQLDTTPLNGITAGNCPTISWSVDGLAVQTQLLAYSASPVNVTLGSSLASGTHTLKLWFLRVTLNSALAMGDRWNTPASCVKITGFTIDGASSLANPTLRSKRAIAFSDSTLEGADAVGFSNNQADQDSTQTYAQLMAEALDAEIGIVGNSYQGYQASGSGNFPVLPSTWNYYYSGASRLFTSIGAAGGTLLYPSPDYLLDGHGTNDRAANQTTQQSLLQTQIASYRAAAGTSCKILMLVPPGGVTRTAKAAAVTASGDNKCYMLDAGSDFDATVASGGRNTNDGLHPSVRGHAEYESRLIKAGQTAGAIGTVITTAQRRFIH